MPTFPINATGVYVNEFDFSGGQDVLGRATLVVIGGASKGTPNLPTRCANADALQRTFGPKRTDDYGLQAAARFHEKGTELFYMRVVDGTETTSDRFVTGQSGGAAATQATGTITFSANPDDGDTITIDDGTQVLTAATSRITFDAGAQPLEGETVTVFDGTTTVVFEFDSDAIVSGGNTAVSIGVDVAATLGNLVAEITGSALTVTAVDDSANTPDPSVLMTQVTPGAAGNSGTTATTGVNIIVTNFTGGLDVNEVIFEFDDDAAVTGTNTSVLIGGSSIATAQNLVAAMAASGLTFDLFELDTSGANPVINLSTVSLGTQANNTMTASGGGNEPTPAGFAGATDAVAPTGAGNVLRVYAASPGSWGNDVEVQVVNPSTQPGAAATSFDLLILEPPDPSQPERRTVQERYVNLNLDPADDRYIEKIVEAGQDAGVSASTIITVDVLDTTGTAYPTTGSYRLGTNGGVVGTDGVSGLQASDYVGVQAGEQSTGLERLRNPEQSFFNVLAIPGVANATVIEAAIALAEYRGDFVYLVDPPFGLDSVEKITNWHNGLDNSTPDAPTAALDSTYAVLSWPWVFVADDGLYLPPSGHVAANLTEGWQNTAEWFSIMGFNRGRIAAQDVEYSASPEDRATLAPAFGGTNRVNPIVNIINEGLIYYGNRTLLRRDSLLADFNIRTLLIYAEVSIADAVKFLIGEPNDPVSRREFLNLVNPKLASIAAQRGLFEFRVRADESNNPAKVVREKRLAGSILLRPIPSIERIELNFGVFDDRVEFDESVI